MDYSVLIIGSDGSIGKSLLAVLQADGKVVCSTTRHRNQVKELTIYLDLSEDMTQIRLPSLPISTAIFCAAVTSQEKCKTEKEYSRLVNVEGTVTLAKRLAESGIFIVFLSTNLVFDGKKPFAEANDPFNSQTEYGRQKAEAESQLLKLVHGLSIVRLTKVIYPDYPIFQKWVHDLKAGKEINPFHDMVISPIPLDFVTAVLSKIINNQIQGIIQVSGAKDISYADAALQIAHKLCFDEKLIKPISYRDAGIEFAPENTTLDITRLQSELNMTPPDVYDAVTSGIK